MIVDEAGWRETTAAAADVWVDLLGSSRATKNDDVHAVRREGAEGS